MKNVTQQYSIRREILFKTETIKDYILLTFIFIKTIEILPIIKSTLILKLHFFPYICSKNRSVPHPQKFSTNQ